MTKEQEVEGVLLLVAVLLIVVLPVTVAKFLMHSPDGAQAQAQGRYPTNPWPGTPANVRAENGAVPGQVVVSWDAAPGAAYYRVGWAVHSDDLRSARAEGGDGWLDAFAFRDVANHRQADLTLTGLEPGGEYAFVASSVWRRFGIANGWSEWTYLTVAEAEAVSCPAHTGIMPYPTTAPSSSPDTTVDDRYAFPADLRQGGHD